MRYAIIVLVSLVVFYFLRKRDDLLTLFFMSLIVINLRTLAKVFVYLDAIKLVGADMFAAVGLTIAIDTAVSWAVMLLCWYMYRRRKTSQEN